MGLGSKNGIEFMCGEDGSETQRKKSTRNKGKIEIVGNGQMGNG